MYLSVGNIVDIVLAVFFILAIVRGWYVGLALRVAHLAVVVASVVAARILAGIIGIPVLAGLFFFIALAVFWQIVKLVKIVDHIPIIGKLDKLGGALLGLALAVLFCYILFAYLDIVVPRKTWNEWGLTKAVVNKTYILKTFLS